MLPVFETFLRKQVVEKDTRIVWIRQENSGTFLPWTSMTNLRISNEQGVFLYPDSLPDDIKIHRVHITFLRRSKLVLDVTELR